MAAKTYSRTEASVIADMDAGKSVRYDTDWSDKIRRTPAPVAPVETP